MHPYPFHYLATPESGCFWNTWSDGEAPSKPVTVNPESLKRQATGARPHFLFQVPPDLHIWGGRMSWVSFVSVGINLI